MKFVTIINLLYFHLKLTGCSYSGYKNVDYVGNEEPTETVLPTETTVQDLILGCPEVSLPNGEVKYFAARNKAEFSCHFPYSLVSNESAVCESGSWSPPPPICAPTDCSTLSPPLHGSIEMSHANSVATATCDDGFHLIGSKTLICTENGWSNDMPYCRATSLHQFDVCHFEPNDHEKCKWIGEDSSLLWIVIKAEHHPDNYSFPQIDHTKAPNFGGHYLYLMAPSSYISLYPSRDNAKYISPLFPPTIDSKIKSCLIFFTYSYGSTAGTITVFLNNDPVWENISHRANKWLKVVINLENQPFPFRITIEGSRHGLAKYSNTAIDDLGIFRDKDCDDDSDRISPYTVDSYDPTMTETITNKMNHKLFADQPNNTFVSDRQSDLVLEPSQPLPEVLEDKIAYHERINSIIISSLSIFICFSLVVIWISIRAFFKK